MGLLAAAAVGLWSLPPPPITVSRETTHLTVPLRADGSVDYEAAASRDFQGVDNIGAAMLPLLLRPEQLARVGIAASGQPLFRPLPEGTGWGLESSESACEGDTDPKIRAWLEPNAQALDAIAAAVRDGNRWVLPAAANQQWLVDTRLLVLIRHVGLAFRLRAGLRFCEGDLAGGTRHLVTLARLASAMAGTPWLCTTAIDCYRWTVLVLTGAASDPWISFGRTCEMSQAIDAIPTPPRERLLEALRLAALSELARQHAEVAAALRRGDPLPYSSGLPLRLQWRPQVLWPWDTLARDLNRFSDLLERPDWRSAGPDLMEVRALIPAHPWSYAFVPHLISHDDDRVRAGALAAAMRLRCWRSLNGQFPARLDELRPRVEPPLSGVHLIYEPAGPSRQSFALKLHTSLAGPSDFAIRACIDSDALYVPDQAGDEDTAGRCGAQSSTRQLDSIRLDGLVVAMAGSVLLGWPAPLVLRARLVAPRGPGSSAAGRIWQLLTPYRLAAAWIALGIVLGALGVGHYLHSVLDDLDRLHLVAAWPQVRFEWPDPWWAPVLGATLFALATSLTPALCIRQLARPARHEKLRSSLLALLVFGQYVLLLAMAWSQNAGLEDVVVSFGVYAPVLAGVGVWVAWRTFARLTSLVRRRSQ